MRGTDEGSKEPNWRRVPDHVRPLSKEEGGGYLVQYPEIPGCMSDGETVEEAIANGREALRDCRERCT